MFLDWKNQYCENDSSTQNNLQIQRNPYENANAIFHRTRTKKKSQFLWKDRRNWIAKAILRMKNEARGINFSDFILYYKVTAIKRVWYWQKQKYTPMEQDRKLRINPHTYGHLIFDKLGKNIYNIYNVYKNIQWRKDSLFNKWSLEN